MSVDYRLKQLEEFLFSLLRTAWLGLDIIITVKRQQLWLMKNDENGHFSVSNDDVIYVKALLVAVR